jgi:hypothetical protein
MGTYLLAMGIILIVMFGWVAVQRMARLFAFKHPEFGPYPEGGGGCAACGCSNDRCGAVTDKERCMGRKN